MKLMTKNKHQKNQLKNQPKDYVSVFESDGTYFLKLVVVVLLGTFWIKFSEPFSWMGNNVWRTTSRYPHRVFNRTHL